MSDSRLTVVMLVMTTIGMAGGLLVLSHLLGRFRNGNVDRTPYECGIRPFEHVERHRYSIHFYLVAMLFILFDIEAAFLFPWAVTFRGFADNRLFVLGEMVVFLGILLVGFVYLWKRGALEWE